MKKIGIVGYGYVGKAFTNMVKDRYQVLALDKEILYEFREGKIIGKHKADGNSKKIINQCDLGVICVPTPMKKEDYVEADGIRIYRCDTSIVEEVASWLDTPVILIKSTIEPGTTDRLKAKYQKKIVFSPEYVGEGKYYVSPRMDFQTDMRKTPFVILGGSKEDCRYIFDLLVPILGPEKRYMRVEPIEAEIIKYMENFYFGWKLSFVNIFYDACQKAKADWYQVRDGWAMDPRVDIMHTAVFPENRGFAGKCLPKDLNAFTYWLIKNGLKEEAKPFVEMLKYNLKLRRKKDYLEV
jgi:nucleotide sugar dehydrogenase